jgi:hypothetical protein
MSPTGTISAQAAHLADPLAADDQRTVDRTVSTTAHRFVPQIDPAFEQQVVAIAQRQRKARKSSPQAGSPQARS